MAFIVQIKYNLIKERGKVEYFDNSIRRHKVVQNDTVVFIFKLVLGKGGFGMGKTDHLNKELGLAIISRLGGPENIKSLNHCSTRLRAQLIDPEQLDLEQIKAVPGVLGAVEAIGGVQIIVGNNVSKVYAELQRQYQFTEGAEATGGAKFYDRLLNMISAIVGPAIPPIMGSGLLSAILVIAGMLGVNKEGNTYYLLSTAANVVFYFLPFILAYSAAVRFRCNPIYAIFFGGLMMHPNISALVGLGEPVRLFGMIPVTLVDYSSTLIPIIITVWVLSYVERAAERYVPEFVRYAFKPLVIILVMTPVTLCVTGPLGAIVGNGLGAILTAVYNQANWLALLLLGVLAPFMVLTGMHLAILPLTITNFNTLGFDNLLLVAFIGMNFSQFGVSLAVLLKTKQPNLKQLAGTCALTAFLSGVTEPTLYGICLRLKRPLIATCIATSANAIFCAVFGVKTYAFGAPSFFTMPVFINPNAADNNFLFACMAAALTVIVAFAATWLLGFDDSIYESK